MHEGYDPARDGTMRCESGTLAAIHVFGVLTPPSHATLNGTAIPFTYDAQHKVRVQRSNDYRLFQPIESRVILISVICVLTLVLVLR